jgi:hypothetical protein
MLVGDGRWGFSWARADGTETTLAELVGAPGAEPERWLPTHLEALDEQLVDLAGRHGEVLGGGRRPTESERAELAEAYLAIDRAVLEYAAAARAVGGPTHVRAGLILGTAALLGIRARSVLGLTGAAPFEGELDQPSPGMVGGRAGLQPVDEHEPWRGSRWLVVADDGRRLPATLSMLLFDASGVDKEAALREHREALAEVTEAVVDPAAEPMAAAGAVDWLLFDWLMAHREGPDSAAVQIPTGREGEAALVVAAAAASVEVRRRVDPALARATRPH